MNIALGIFVPLLFYFGFLIWECSSWVSARARIAREQARRMKLENDRIEALQRATDASPAYAMP